MQLSSAQPPRIQGRFGCHSHRTDVIHLADCQILLIAVVPARRIEIGPGHFSGHLAEQLDSPHRIPNDSQLTHCPTDHV